MQQNFVYFNFNFLQMNLLWLHSVTDIDIATYDNMTLQNQRKLRCDVKHMADIFQHWAKQLPLAIKVKWDVISFHWNRVNDELWSQTDMYQIEKQNTFLKYKNSKDK